MSGKLDKLRKIENKGALADSRESSESEKVYKTEKMLRGLNPDIERYYETSIGTDRYPNYTTFIRAAIREFAEQHGFKG